MLGNGALMVFLEASVVVHSRCMSVSSSMKGVTSGEKVFARVDGDWS